VIEIDFLFKNLSGYQTHKNTIDKLIDYFLSQIGDTLLGQEITLDNYKEMLNQVFLACKLEKDLEKKEEIKKN